MEEKPRYSKFGDLIQILMLMQIRVQGVSLSDIMKEIGVSRRTAERMRDCLYDNIPQIKEISNPSSREKYWGLPHGSMREIINFTPEEIANLEKLKKLEHEQGSEDREKSLNSIIEKIKALNIPAGKDFNSAIEFLMQTEGFAVRQTPRFKIDLQILGLIREALKRNKLISAKYNGKEKMLAPYGLIYGSKVYLIAVEKDKGETPFCYLLHKLTDVKISVKSFEKVDFNLEEFSKKSFGVYQGEQFNVKLLFVPSAAEDVLNYHFHSTQKMKRNDDGSVTVTFKASGEYEIMWPLFRWGSDVKILAPAKLKKDYIELLEKTMKNQKDKVSRSRRKEENN